MSGSVFSYDPEQRMTVKTVTKEDPAAARCGVELLDDSSKQVKLLIYEESTAAGGTRKLLLDEEGDITLSGYEESLRILDQDQNIEYSTNIERLDYELESIRLDNLGSAPASEHVFQELGELLYWVEAEEKLLT